MSLKNLLTEKRLNSSLKYTFATVLIFIPLYPKFPLLTLPGSSVAIRLEDFLIAFLGLLTFLSVRHRLTSFFSSLTAKALVVYFLIGFISVLGAVLVTKTVSAPVALLHWFRRIEYAIPFFAGLVLARNRENLRFFLEIIPLVALGVLLYGLGQIYLQLPVISTQNPEFSKGIALTLQPGVNLSSTFAGHYDLAAYLVMTISLLLGVLFSYKAKRSKIIMALFLLALFWLQLRSGSRIGFLAILISPTLVLLLSRRPVWIIPVYIIAVIGLANTPAISGRFGDLLNVFRFQSLQDQVKGVFETRGGLVKTTYAVEELPTPTPTLRPIQLDRSTSIRLDVEWPRAIRAWIKNPFLGTGFSSISLATDNDYLRALGETGSLGFLAWISILIALLADLIRGLKSRLSSLEHQYLVGFAGLLSGFLLIATFLDVFEASKVATLFWAYAGLASGLKK